MSKHPLLVLILLAGLAPARAQKTQRPANPWSLSILAGPTIPAGAFASTDLLNSEAGRARTGAGAELALTYWPIRSIGIMVAVAGQINSMRPYTASRFGYPGIITAQNDPWKIARYLAGPTASLGLSKRLSLEGRLLGGVLKTSYPSVVYTYNNSLTDRFHATSIPWTFDWEAGAGCKWQLPGKGFLLADVSYQISKPWSHPIQSVQLGLGAGIGFR
jgi:hypothetical protein